MRDRKEGAAGVRAQEIRSLSLSQVRAGILASTHPHWKDANTTNSTAAPHNTHGHACTSLDAITCASQDGDLVAPVEGGHLLGRPVLLRFSFGNRTRLVLPMRAPLDLLRSVSNVLPTSLHRAGNSTRPVGAAQHALITVQSWTPHHHRIADPPVTASPSGQSPHAHTHTYACFVEFSLF